MAGSFQSAKVSTKPKPVPAVCRKAVRLTPDPLNHLLHRLVFPFWSWPIFVVRQQKSCATLANYVDHSQPLTVSGDNLIVDLDISVGNLPAGTRLRVGEAVVEVTPKPHNGCVKFRGRFGLDALCFVQASATRYQNLRGIYWKVVQAGEASVNAAIDVLSRPGNGA